MAGNSLSHRRRNARRPPICKKPPPPPPTSKIILIAEWNDPYLPISNVRIHITPNNADLPAGDPVTSHIVIYQTPPVVYDFVLPNLATFFISVFPPVHPTTVLVTAHCTWSDLTSADAYTYAEAPS